MTLLSLGDCRRRRRFRGSTYSLDIVALPRPAAFLGAALGHGPDFADRMSLCLLALAVPAGMYTPLAILA